MLTNASSVTSALMADADLRALERAYTAEGTLQALDALDQARLRSGLGTHPHAAQVRLEALTQLTLLVGTRLLIRTAQMMSAGYVTKPFLTAQYCLYLCTRLDKLREKATTAKLDGRAKLATTSVIHDALAIHGLIPEEDDD